MTGWAGRGPGPEKPQTRAQLPPDPLWTIRSKGCRQSPRRWDAPRLWRASPEDPRSLHSRRWEPPEPHPWPSPSDHLWVGPAPCPTRRRDPCRPSGPGPSRWGPCARSFRSSPPVDSRTCPDRLSSLRCCSLAERCHRGPAGCSSPSSTGSGEGYSIPRPAGGVPSPHRRTRLERRR